MLESRFLVYNVKKKIYNSGCSSVNLPVTLAEAFRSMWERFLAGRADVFYLVLIEVY